jgi:exonuclease SbcD
MLMGAGMAETVLALMQRWAATNDLARAAGIPTIGVSHGTVNGCRTETGVPMMGLDHEFTTGALFEAHCSAFLLGHIHEHQEWEQHGHRIAYPGSIGRLHFGELTDKGFLIWTVDAMTAQAEFVVTPSKRLIQVECEGVPDMAKLAELAAQAETEGASVRIRWSIDEEHKHAVDKEAITQLFAKAGQVKLEGHINPIVRTRASGMNRAVTLADKVRKWAEVTGTEAEPLVERLAMLEAE